MKTIYVKAEIRVFTKLVQNGRYEVETPKYFRINKEVKPMTILG
jgi:hypothetical protein